MAFKHSLGRMTGGGVVVDGWLVVFIASAKLVFDVLEWTPKHQSNQLSAVIDIIFYSLSRKL